MSKAGDSGGDQLFAIEKHAEIVSLIKRLINRRCMFTVHLDSGEHSLLTSIIDIGADGKSIVVDTSPDAVLNRRVRQARTLLFHTQVDQVEVRFRTGALKSVMFNGLAAFTAAMPQQVYYLQQREFFRLKVPVSRPVLCDIVVPAAEPEQLCTVLPMRAFDISVGGVALLLTASQAAHFAVGNIFDDVRITLPDSGSICPKIRVCHINASTDARGASRIQAGCQFLEPGHSMQAIIQRYIMRVERAHIARDRGLA